MPNVSISPLFNEAQYFDNNGNPLSGGKIFQYQAGSFTVEQTTYNSESGLTPNPNPIILDSSGRTNAGVYLVDGQAYNLVLTMPDGTTILKNSDDVVGVQPAGSVTPTTNVWNTVTQTPTYVAPTQFLIPGTNYTTQFAVGNRVLVTYTDDTVAYGTVSAVSFSSNNTYVTLALDGANLQNNLRNVAWSALISTGITVDAAGVSFKTALTYASGTVGGQINSNFNTLNGNITATNNRITRNAITYGVDYTTPYNYTLNLSPISAGSLSDPQFFSLVFLRGNNGSPCTLNINGLGAYSLKQYNSSGTLSDPNISGFLTTMVAFNGSNYIVLNPTPAATVIQPHGAAAYSVNGSFTVPANVYNIKVTCVGGGGGAYSSSYYGGGGCTTVGYMSVSPGQVYAISVGAGGTNASIGVGGSTSFGIDKVVANGGNQYIGGTVGSLGSGVGGIVYAGNNGYWYAYYVDIVLNVTGMPGSAWGGGGQPNGYGCGGSYNGTGNGNPGLVLVEW